MPVKKISKLLLPLSLMLSLMFLSVVSTFANETIGDEEAMLDLYGGEEMISIATGSQQPVSKAPAVASVITARQIKAMGATDIDEVLEGVPGLHVSTRAFGYGSIYTFRGIRAEYNAQVLVLINGIPITNLFNGDRNLIWGGMPVQAIARIEVIRGPGSALYGADAFAGVINLITKSRKDIDGTLVGGRGGSFDTQDAWLLHGADWADTEVAFMLEYHKTQGHGANIDADTQSTFDLIAATDASYAPGEVNLQRDNLDVRLQLEHQYWSLRAGLQRRRGWGNGAGVADTLDPHNRYQSDRWNIDLTYHNPDYRKLWDVTAQLSYLDTSQQIEKDLIIFPPGADLTFAGLTNFPDGMIGNPEAYERHSRASVSAFYRALTFHQLRLGGGYYYGDLYKTQESKNFGMSPTTGLPLLAGADITDVSDTGYVFLPEKIRRNAYLFIQDAWSIAPDWVLTAGLRYDNYSDFGSTTNPRLALVWSMQQDMTVKLLYGRAFRAPSMTESYAINNPVSLGNPSVKPETMESVELAFNYHMNEHWQFGFNVFHYVWKDIIDFVPDANSQTSTAQNSGEQKSQGGELEIRWNPGSQISIDANYSLQHARDENNGEYASDVPQQQLYLGLNWTFQSYWNLHSQLHWVLDRQRNVDDTRRNIEDYRWVNLTLRRRGVSRHLDIAFSVRNLFGSDARNPSAAAGIVNDLPLAGRHFYGEVQYRF